MSEEFVSVPAEHIGNVFGNYDENIKELEKLLEVTVLNRGDDVKVTGEQAARAADILKKMVIIASH